MSHTFRMLLNEQPPAPSSVVAGFPPELDAIVLKALEKEPDKRYQTALEMRAALESYIAASGPPMGQEEVGGLVTMLYEDERNAVRERIRKIMSEESEEEIPVTVLPMLVESAAGIGRSSPLLPGEAPAVKSQPPQRWTRGRIAAAAGGALAIAALGYALLPRANSSPAPERSSSPPREAPATAAAAATTTVPSPETPVYVPRTNEPSPKPAVANPSPPQVVARVAPAPVPKAPSATGAAATSAPTAAPVATAVPVATAAPPAPVPTSSADAPPSSSPGKRKFRTEL
jgi:serine/threonine-protein kinase